MRIDAHQHYWDPSREDYGWLTPDKGILYRNYSPQDLESSLVAHDFSHSIAVQAAPSIEETLYLLEWSDITPSIIGVVGWLDFEAPDFDAQFAKLRKHPRFVGVRPMIQDLPEDWLLRPTVIANLNKMASMQFPVDLQLRPFLMDTAVKLMEQVPTLRAVVDHIAKPAQNESIDDWKRGMKKLAEYSSIMCKLSGMVPEETVPWTVDQLRPYVEYTLELFGPDRIIYGSDWPVCLLSANYTQVYQLLNELLPTEWSEEKRAGVWGKNAVDFYHLDK
jgi:L-fuconolactonase